MSTRPDLTDRQSQILQFVNDYRWANQMPPTRQEIAAHFGFSSANAAEDHLHALMQKGYITLVPKVARGIRVIG